MATLTIPIEGALDIRHCTELKGQLMEQLEKATSVQVNLQGVSSADTAGLQLLSSVHRHATKNGIEFEWTHVSSQILEKAQELGMPQESFLKSNTDAQKE